MVHPSNVVDMPPLSVKLCFSMADGVSYEGTGFCVEHAKRLWLITCRHNLEDRDEGFVGVTDVSAMSLVGESEITIGQERTVVAIRVGGFIADCAAIELLPHEWSTAPRFDTSISMTFEGEQMPDKVGFSGPPPESRVAYVKPTGWVAYQGFACGVEKPETRRGVRATVLPHAAQAWMLTLLPANEEGFSGGPVFDLTQDTTRLLAILTHRFDAEVEWRQEDGSRVEIGMPASFAMPLAPLLWALERNPSGHCIIDVPLPVCPFSASMLPRVEGADR